MSEGCWSEFISLCSSSDPPSIAESLPGLGETSSGWKRKHCYRRPVLRHQCGSQIGHLLPGWKGEMARSSFSTAETLSSHFDSIFSSSAYPPSSSISMSKCLLRPLCPPSPLCACFSPSVLCASVEATSSLWMDHWRTCSSSSISQWLCPQFTLQATRGKRNHLYKNFQKRGEDPREQGWWEDLERPAAAHPHWPPVQSGCESRSLPGSGAALVLILFWFCL